MKVGHGGNHDKSMLRTKNMINLNQCPWGPVIFKKIRCHSFPLNFLDFLLDLPKNKTKQKCKVGCDSVANTFGALYHIPSAYLWT